MHPHGKLEIASPIQNRNVEKTPQPNTILNVESLVGKWLRKEISEREDFLSQSWPPFEYFSDSTFLNNQLCYSDNGVYWISDSFIFEVWPDKDTTVERIILLDSSNLIVENKKGKTLHYVKYVLN